MDKIRNFERLICLIRDMNKYMDEAVTMDYYFLSVMLLGSMNK